MNFDDIDTNDTVSISSAYNSDIVWSGGSLGAGLITQLTSGTFSASVLAAAAPGSTPWTYTANDVNLDFLAVGETITFSFTVTATDNHSATDTDVVTITITGTNNAPTVTATPAFANFTEDVDASTRSSAQRHGELRRRGHERHGVDQLGVQQRHRVEWRFAAAAA